MVVDTSAIFAIVLGEPEREAFGQALKAAQRRRMSAATAVECVAALASRRPSSDPMIAIDLILSDLAVEIVPMDLGQWRTAADALIRYGKGRHPARLNLGDSFAYALAKVTGEPLLYKGRDFALTDVESAL
jgi:ribonuclease VapC